ncbi:signal recognition particle-docking protein FtsY [Roseibium sp. CAU 1637]|uniref:Signal recognition particle receptor FtsY n=1 Tax=Roseibium limicola TaxID=2816037 RepID=A0A939ESC9_9HYPH|nr:signal recognition particle-docking protein FtsY [Roseibium limicola]MBO0346728.1 signal recognition particle-docking protein FtsY [Roseibium limicola]
MSETKRGFFGRLFGAKDDKPESAPEDVKTDSPAEDTASETDASETPTAAAIPDGVVPAEAPPVPDPGQQEDGEAAELPPLTGTAPAEAIEPAVENAAWPEPDVAAPPEPTPVTEAEPAAATPVPAEAPVTSDEPDQPKQSWFHRLRAGLSRSSSALTDGISSIFTKRKLDAAMLEELEDVLIQADLGVDTAMSITERLSDGRYNKEIAPEEVRAILAEEVEKVLEPVAKPLDLNRGNKLHVVLMVGVNGTGKTTTIGKLSQKLAREGKTVMLAAGDTFRAAAVEQLKIWGERTGASVIARDTGADAAGLAFDAMKEAKEKGVDVLLIDTAGRLQNRTELMEELEKVIRVIKKHDPQAPHDVLLTLDATTGQNALNQVEIFGRVAGVTGLVMTKLDGTARGGILVAIAAKFKLPVHFIGIGEGVEDLEPFSAKDFATAIAGGA